MVWEPGSLQSYTDETITAHQFQRGCGAKYIVSFSKGKVNNDKNNQLIRNESDTIVSRFRKKNVPQLRTWQGLKQV